MEQIAVAIDDEIRRAVERRLVDLEIAGVDDGADGRRRERRGEVIVELIHAVDANILVALGPAPDLDIDAKVDALRSACPRLAHVLHVPAAPGIALRPGQRDFVAELSA